MNRLKIFISATIAIVFLILIKARSDSSAEMSEHDANVIKQQEKAKSKDVNQKMRNSLRDIFIGDIDIKAEVVDERENRITGIKMHTTLFRKGQHEDQKMIDGQFHIKCEDCMAIYVRLSKDGYYKLEKRFSIGSEVPHGPSGKREIKDSDMKILLEEIGPATYLAKFDNELRFDCNGEAHGPFITPSDIVRKIDVYNRQESNPQYVHLNFNQDPSTIPPGVFYFRAICADGRIVPLNELIKLVYHGGSSYRGEDDPKEVYFGITGEGNGVQVYSPSDPMLRDGLILRRMREAPGEGYQREILLNNREANNFFYCRIGDYYGKGNTGASSDKKSNGAAIIGGINLWVQPDKSRNLRMLP